MPQYNRKFTTQLLANNIIPYLTYELCWSKWKHTSSVTYTKPEFIVVELKEQNSTLSALLEEQRVKQAQGRYDIAIVIIF